MDKEDYIREFEFEHGRCQGYFDLMYKTFQFTFAFVVALLAIAFRDEVKDTYINLILQYVLPIGLYVFGVLYIHNIYVLFICGERAELLHEKIYKNLEDVDEKGLQLVNILKKYVLTDRKLTILSYGVPVGFYILMPITSCITGTKFKPFFASIIMKYLPYIFFVAYFIIMFLVILKIIKINFKTKQDIKFK